MNKTNICFLLGYAGVGKDTVGEIFVKHGYTRVAFADLVKQEYATLNNLDYNKLQTDREYKETHRLGIIEYAESFRKKDPNYWINKAFEPYIDPLINNFKEGLKLVITDCRRSGEIDWVLNQKQYIDSLNEQHSSIRHYVNITLIQIINPNIIDPDTITHYTIGYAHGIQQMYPNFIDASIYNDKTLLDLERKTSECINYLGL
jgi:hypothetical protein